jgi:peptide deformylase
MSLFARWPQPVLRRPAAPVAAIDAQARAIWDEMLAAMYATPGIVGLAAPQLGHGVRLAVLDCSEARDAPVRLANPELVRVSDETARRAEGSPHLPGLMAEIERPAEVRVRFLDGTGRETERDFDGLWAAAVQHQIDHLEGRMFFDRLSRMRRQRLLAAHAKRGRRGR